MIDSDRPRPSRPRTFFVAGDVNVDLMSRLPRLPDADEEVEMDTLEFTPGGTAGNTAVAMARLGMEVAVATGVGEDDFGDFVIKRLQREKVVTRWIVRFPEATGVCVALVEPHGDRRLASFRGANKRLEAEHLTSDLFAWADGVHMTGVSPDIARRILEGTDATGGWLSQDPGNMMCEMHRDVVIEFGARASINFISRTEARLLTAATDPETVARRVQRFGWGLTVLKLGPQGSALLYEGRVVFRIPAFSTTVVDTTGAGDAFDAGFLWGASRGRDWAACARLGSAVAALAVSKLGGQTGLPDEEELAAFLQAQSEQFDSDMHTDAEG